MLEDERKFQLLLDYCNEVKLKRKKFENNFWIFFSIAIPITLTLTVEGLLFTIWGIIPLYLLVIAIDSLIAWHLSTNIEEKARRLVLDNVKKETIDDSVLNEMIRLAGIAKSKVNIYFYHKSITV